MQIYGRYHLQRPFVMEFAVNCQIFVESHVVCNSNDPVTVCAQCFSMTEVWSLTEAVETTSSVDAVVAVEAAVDELAVVLLSELHAARRVPPISNEAAIKVIFVFSCYLLLCMPIVFLKTK